MADLDPDAAMTFDGSDPPPEVDNELGEETALPIPLSDAAARPPARAEALPVPPLPAPPSPPPTSGALPFSASTRGHLILGVVADLVTRGLIPERKAVSIALHAREVGETFFRALAQDPVVTGVESIYHHIAEQIGEELITEAKDCLAQAEPADWLPMDAAEQRGIVQIGSFDPDTIRYAAIDPFDIATRDWIRRCTGRAARPVPVLPQAFFEALDMLKHRRKEPEGTGQTMVSIAMSYDEEQRTRHALEDCEAPQIINYILHRSFIAGASDVHFEPTDGRLIIRLRIDGILHEETNLPADFHPPLTSRIKVLAGMDLAEKRRPQDGRISARIGDRPVDVRVSSMPTVSGEKMVMRLLDEGALLPKLEQLGLVERDLAVLRDRINAPSGLIMISGPTGSGKTMTLYSCLSTIDRKRKNVVTIEDPVEYRLKGVHQVQANEKIGLTFANGLRTILRQDPEVIMVGECRDPETAAMAIQASLTGHVVFSTIHANDSIGVVSRLLDMGVDPFLVANALKTAMAQRLVRSICVQCRSMVAGRDIVESLRNEGVSERKLKDLGITIEPDVSYPHAVGCTRCRNTGYTGRQAVFEIFDISEDCRPLVMAQPFNADTLKREAIRKGLTPMLESGIRLIDEGRTTHAEILRVFGET